MPMKNYNCKDIVVSCLLSISCLPLPALADGSLNLTTGVDYSTGKYGQSESTHVTYIPITAKYETDDSSIKLTLPWLEIRGPGDVVGADAALVRTNAVSRKRTVQSGMGDIVLSATHAIATLGESSPLSFDLTGKIKFGTASESQGLGTGKNDYTLALDAYKPIYNHTVGFAGVGYKKMGDPSGTNLRNVWLGSVGVSYKINPRTNLGIMADFRQKTLETSEPLREVTLFSSYKLSNQYKLQTYLVHGYSKVSADWGGGIMLGHTF